jgi:hypothetical protein
MKWPILLALLGGACSSQPRPGPGPAPTGSGSASGVKPTGTVCDAQRAKIEQLYRARARDREPSRVEEAVADNTTMVLNDCVQAPDKTAACIAAATTVQDLEARCLVPLDDEGTEGDKLTR